MYKRLRVAIPQTNKSQVTKSSSDLRLDSFQCPANQTGYNANQTGYNETIS